MSTDEMVKGHAESKPRNPPKLLYRYLGCFGLDAVANLELKVTPPNEFNDPLEFTPRIVAETDKDWQAYYEVSKRQSGFPEISYDQFRRSYSITQNANVVQRLFQNLASGQFSVLCLSRNPTSVTQWAHYAAHHTGLVLELDTASEPLLSFVRHGLCAEVNYLKPSERKPHPLHQIVNASGTKEIAQMLLEVAAEKSEEWRQEEEWRLIIPLPEASFLQSRLVGGHLMHFLQLSEGAISRVILGARVSDEFEREVRKVTAMRGIPEERVVRASIDHENFCVAI